MAKFGFIQNRKVKKKNEENIGKRRKNKQKKTLGERIINTAAAVVDATDEICLEVEEIAAAGVSGLFSVGAAVVNFVDFLVDLIIWFVLKIFVQIGRKVHEFSVSTIKYKKVILKNGIVLGIGCICMVAVFACSTDYEYSYNGRALGVVKEQSDVLDILELASEELSQEYGSNIEINPETDITFRTVVSYGKEIDSEDDVLRRLTYMGEINAQASAIVAEGKILVIVENEQIANQVLEDLKKMFLTDSDSTEYEYVGFVEDVTIKPVSTKLTNVSSRSTAVQKLKNGGQKALTYKVQSGDSVYGICDKLGISLSELESLNPGLTVDSMIHIGDTIKIEREVPLLTLETIEVTKYAESIPYEKEYQDSGYYYEGETAVSREGQEGKASITARLTKHNGEVVDKEELDREVLREPVSKIILRGTKPVPPKEGTGTFIRPVNVGISYGFGMRWGRMHTGIDLPASTGTAIKASDGGTVVHAGWYYGYGYAVIINHGGNIKTLYGHCSRLYVSAGERVFQGQTIAAVGNTGNSMGSHCHFEIIKNGSYLNPAGYV